MNRAGGFRPTWAEIDLTKLHHNFQQVSSMVGGGQHIIPMIKAEAYGHGAVKVAQCFDQSAVPYLGVALVEEALELRQAGVKKPILLFGPCGAAEASLLREQVITPVVSTVEGLRALQSVAGTSETAWKIHLKVNTGMNRLGLALGEVKNLLGDLRKFSVEAICTHLYQGEDAGISGGKTEKQLQEFLAFHQLFPVQTHIFNSSGVGGFAAHLKRGEKPIGAQWWPEQSDSMVRPGLALYGIPPATFTPVPWNLQPVMTLRSQICSLQKVARGQVVSYSGTWTARQESLIGVVPVGYADGYPRHLSNKGFMLYRGNEVPIVGNVCMDYTLIDLTLVAGLQPKVGDAVVLFGRDGEHSLPVERVAQLAETIPYEIITCIGRRVPRHYLSGAHGD